MTTSTAHIPLLSFVVNLVLAAVLAALLGKVYVRFGKSLSNRRLFARNFLLLSVTIMLIISIVKSSLALSLGLVGALSIVRYRAAIKEPEELTYLFLAISIGLGMGANQTVITVTAFALIVGIIWVRDRTQDATKQPNLHLTVATAGRDAVPLSTIVETLEKHCQTVDLKRFDESSEGIEAAFLVQYQDFSGLESGRAALRELDDSLSISLLDNDGLA